jgi:sulfide:quinone oxidoreductase
MRPSEIPGLSEHAESIWTPGQMASLRQRLEDLERHAHDGQGRRVLFLVPPGNKCSGPLYEIVFMLETWAREKEIRDRLEIVWSTYEGGFIQAFGPRLHDVVDDEFMQRGVLGFTDEVVTHIEEGVVHYQGGKTREYDLLISFPPYIAAVDYEGFDTDDRGFLPTELETRLVPGHGNIYAPGDGGDFPVKQAFLAFLQADAVADHITHQLTGSAVTTPFDPVSMCVMEMFDKATFAQVPLTLTGDPARPVAVREGAEDLYKVGVSPAWRIGKKMLGLYLPMRFRAGEPFHAGTAWQMMDIGLAGMVDVMTT